MDKRSTLLDYLKQIFLGFGITTAILEMMAVLFGDKLMGYSSMFSLGSQGISAATAFQFLGVIVLIVTLRFIFMTDSFIKELTLTARMVLFFIGSFAVTLVFIFIFGWFPVNDPLAWMMFIVSITVKSVVSTIVSSAAEKQENRQLEEALRRIKEGQ